MLRYNEDGSMDTTFDCDNIVTTSIRNMVNDVPGVGKSWMKPGIEQFYLKGINTGCAVSPLRYCPENNVTRGEMAVFIVRAFHIPMP